MKKVIVAIMAMTILATVSFAEPPMRGGQEKGFSPEKMVEKMGKDLAMTAQQKDQMLAGMKKVEEQSKQLRGKDKEMFAKIDSELLKDVPDRNLIVDCIKQVNQNMTQVQIMRMDEMLNMRKMLTPEQRTKMKEAMKDRKPHKGKGFFGKMMNGRHEKQKH